MTTLQPKLDSTGAAGTSETRLWGVMAEFKTPGTLLEAAGKVHKAGYRWWDCCTPFPVHGLDKVMGIKPTILPVIVFFAGLTGTILAFSLQSFTNSTDWNFWAKPQLVRSNSKNSTLDRINRREIPIETLLKNAV